jgi:hypothetical protein
MAEEFSRAGSRMPRTVPPSDLCAAVIRRGIHRPQNIARKRDDFDSSGVPQIAPADNSDHLSGDGGADSPVLARFRTSPRRSSSMILSRISSSVPKPLTASKSATHSPRNSQAFTHPLGPDSQEYKSPMAAESPYAPPSPTHTPSLISRRSTQPAPTPSPCACRLYLAPGPDPLAQFRALIARAVHTPAAARGDMSPAMESILEAMWLARPPFCPAPATGGLARTANPKTAEQSSQRTSLAKPLHKKNGDTQAGHGGEKGKAKKRLSAREADGDEDFLPAGIFSAAGVLWCLFCFAIYF